MIEQGDHVVEIVFTWLDGTYESFYPSAGEGWTSSVFDDAFHMDTVIIYDNGRANRLEIPLCNVRYYEVIVHNDPMPKHVCDENCSPRVRTDREGVKVMAFRIGPDGEVEPSHVPGQYL